MLLNSAKQIVNDAIGSETVEHIKEYRKTASEAGSKAISSAAKRISDAVDARKKEKETTHTQSPEKKYTQDSDLTKSETTRTRFVSATCPQCGASLEIEDGIDTFFCKYCGEKVVLTNQDAKTLKAKTAVKKFEHREKMTDKLIGHLNERATRKAEEKEKQRKDVNKAMLVLLAVMAVCMIMLLSRTGSQRRESMAEETRLQQIVDQIEIDIDNGDYDAALIKANSLYYTSGYSNDVKKKWDNTRESLIELITEARDAEQTRSAIDPSEGEAQSATDSFTNTQEKVDPIPVEESKQAFSESEDQAPAEATAESEKTAEEIGLSAITASDLTVRTTTDYSHLFSDAVYLGNNEGVTISIIATATGLSADDIELFYDKTLLSVKMDKPTETDGKTLFSAYVTGKKAGNSTLVICTAYDLYLYGENASGFVVEINKLDSKDGRIVYLAPTGEKYHFREKCAGENAIKTTYREVIAYDYQPCGKCAS